jgi:arginine/serine-rich splicing factor 4/5/6
MGLDNREYGRQRCRLFVEWTKHLEKGFRQPEGGKRSTIYIKPTKALFVINFDPVDTGVNDLEKHFEPKGKVLNVRIKKKKQRHCTPLIRENC